MTTRSSSNSNSNSNSSSNSSSSPKKTYCETIPLISTLKGIGPLISARLAFRKIRTREDLLDIANSMTLIQFYRKILRPCLRNERAHEFTAKGHFVPLLNQYAVKHVMDFLVQENVFTAADTHHLNHIMTETDAEDS
jgi:hypothetical protein